MIELFNTITEQIFSGNESYLLLWTMAMFFLTETLLNGAVNNALYANKLMDANKNSIRIILHSVAAIFFFFCFAISLLYTGVFIGKLMMFVLP